MIELQKTPIDDLVIVTPRTFKDNRGYFFESFNQTHFDNAMGHSIAFCQDNQSCSKRGVLRGLHYQIAPKAQAKLVRVLDGVIWDIAVDLRKSSKTFGQWFGLELSSENKKQLLVPKGFAHGFVALSETASVLYKVDEPYSKEHERGIHYDDPVLAIAWPLKDIILSEKDTALPTFDKAELFT